MKNINGIDVNGKKVIVRVDFNVPIKDGMILDDNRIIGSLETINYLIKNNAKIVLLSHLGRIKEESDKQKNSLSIVAKRLQELVNTKVFFTNKTRGEELETLINNLENGNIVLIQNTRFEDYPKTLESSCDEALSKYWASLADIFILDAFGTAHRCHASTYGISKYIPSYAGFLVAKEVEVLTKAINENKKLVLGGSKVDDKIGVIDNLIEKSSDILLGGAMCFTFLKAKGYNVGSSIVSEDKIEYAKDLLNKYNNIHLPIDVVTQSGIKNIEDLQNEDIGYDI